jgi:hypothetical protein
MAWYVDFIVYFWGLFITWLSALFVIPFQQLQVLWILIPLWLAWFFAEFFQEKRGTSLGNAVTNATIVLWGSIDAARQTVSLMGAGEIIGFWNIALRFFLILLLLAYGAFILIFGMKGRLLIMKVGRVRIVTYFVAVLVPVFYNVVPMTIDYMISIFLFFPLFYFFIELIARITPNPKAMETDLEMAKQEGKEENPPLNPPVNFG